MGYVAARAGLCRLKVFLTSGLETYGARSAISLFRLTIITRLVRAAMEKAHGDDMSLLLFSVRSFYCLTKQCKDLCINILIIIV